MRLEKYIIESMSRYCNYYKAKDKNWYVDLANKEYGGYEDATTYGPFNTFDDADEYVMNNFSNPGSFWEDDSGKKPVPKKSPNGRPVIRPSSGRKYRW